MRAKIDCGVQCLGASSDTVFCTGCFSAQWGVWVRLSACTHLLGWCFAALKPLHLPLVPAVPCAGMPALCRPVPEGGVGFDYRLGMGAHRSAAPNSPASLHGCCVHGGGQAGMEMFVTGVPAAAATGVHPTTRSLPSCPLFCPQACPTFGSSC